MSILKKINHRKTQKEKEANDKQYYKDVLDSFGSIDASSEFSFNSDIINRKKDLKVNYDLYNNIVDINEFNYICKPFGEVDDGELPANMVNRDIISGKIKAVESMEITETFDFSVLAVNKEATTRKEKEYFDRIKQYVQDVILQPIQMQIQQEMMQETKGKELTPEEQQKLQEQMQQELEMRTPDEVAKYMAREHQDPAEILAVHLINYISFKEQFKRKTNKGWKHATISANEIYYIGHDADYQPTIEVCNPYYAIFSETETAEFIEDLDEFAMEYYRTTTEIIKMFGNELTEKEIDSLYDKENFGYTFSEVNPYNEVNTHRVVHAAWVALRKIGFLVYQDENGELQEDVVSENYVLNKKGGDIEIRWEWIPEVQEGFKIGDDMYKRCGPVIGQVIDIDNLYKHKLPFCGAVYDNMNSKATSLVDRMKHYQYYYNIIMYRIEALMASDKGKILMMNINSIPKSSEIDLKKFLYYAESLKIGFFNPNEEGNRGDSSVANIAKEIDMSLASDIQKYIGLADYIERRCGESVGINKSIEGQTGQYEAVKNAQMNYSQASGILQTYYDLHNIVKKNLLEILLEKTKALFALNPSQKKLQYILDDMTLAMFEVDYDLLDNSVYGIFVTDNANSKLAKQMVQQLSQAALQNDKANLSTISKTMRSTSVQEAEELLEKGERDAQERAERLEKMRDEAMEKDRQEKAKYEMDKLKFERETMVIQEQMRTDREIQKQTIFSMGFDENKDRDNDGEPDVLEVAKKGIEADIKIRKQDLEEKKFEHTKEKDTKQLEIMKTKMAKNVK